MYLSDADHVAEALPYYGLVDESSQRNSDYAIMSMTDYALFGFLPSWNNLPRSSRIDTRSGPFLEGACEHIQRGRVVVLGLADFLIKSTNKPISAQKTARSVRRRKQD